MVKKEKSAKLQINEERDQIHFDGQKLEYEEFVYYMMNKPKGVISATEDPKHRTVLDLLDDLARSKEVFPVGRLDIDTHGLLLLTNDASLPILFFHLSVMWTRLIRLRSRE